MPSTRWQLSPTTANGRHQSLGCHRLAAADYLRMYDRPKRGAITILFRVLVQRQTVRMHFPVEEIADLGFFDRLPTNATPSAKFFWKSKDLPESHRSPLFAEWTLDGELRQTAFLGWRDDKRPEEVVLE
jgi:hypothetical protein